MTPGTVAPDWQMMVLRSMPSPSWLTEETEDSDVVISTRIRYARNLARFRFPHHASKAELQDIQLRIIAALEPQRLTQRLRLSEAEREFMIGSRLMAPDFEIDKPGRALLYDARGELSIMVNEEDHLRVQGLKSGWQLKAAEQTAKRALKLLERAHSFAEVPGLGYLTASPYNAGTARRASALLHLVGLAHSKQLKEVLKAASTMNLVVRGVFGESTRGVGAFLQVSWTGSQLSPFRGAVSYILEKEREARLAVGESSAKETIRTAAEFAVSSQKLPLADVLRILAYARWAAHLKVKGAPESVKAVDFLASTIELHGRYDPELAARSRADKIRSTMEKILF